MQISIETHLPEKIGRDRGICYDAAMARSDTSGDPQYNRNQQLPLPDDFVFSQANLQAYEDCPRRFWLAYVHQLPWPALEASPVQDHEQLMRLGQDFHRLIERAEIGIDDSRLIVGLGDPLAKWFDAYRRHRPQDLPTTFVEIERVLGMSLNILAPSGAADRSPEQSSHRLIAKYDYIGAEPDGRVVIVDWKTNRRRPDPAGLRRRWQTLVYQYLLVEASAAFAWGPVKPEQIEMRYWFTSAPSQPITFRYDSAQHAENGHRLDRIIAAIFAGNNEEDFPKVPDTETNRRRFCRFCIYRSRCNRGVTAGSLDDIQDEESALMAHEDWSIDISLDDIVEVTF